MQTKILFTFFVIVFTENFAIAQTLPKNGSFENWTNGLPDHWIMRSTGGILQDAGYASSYSVNLWSTTCYDPDAMGYLPCSGSLIQTDTGNFKPLSISGYWKGTAGILLEINVSDADKNQIGSASTNLGVSNDWTYFIFPINYISNVLPAYTTVTIGDGVSGYGNIDSLQITYISPSNVAEIENKINFEISPNPALGNFTIQSIEEIKYARVEIHNMLGEKFYSQQLKNKQETISCKRFPAGIYFVKVTDGQKQSNQKLIIQ